jgi:streptogramin lyase
MMALAAVLVLAVAAVIVGVSLAGGNGGGGAPDPTPPAARRPGLWTLDPESGRVLEGVATPELGQRITNLGGLTNPRIGALVLTDDSVWVAANDLLIRHARDTAEVTDRTAVPYWRHLTVGGGAVWVIGCCDDAGHFTLSRVDTDTSAVVDSIQLGDINFQESVAGLAFGSGSVWVGTVQRNVIRLDAQTDDLTGTIPVDADVSGLAFGDRALWFTSEFPTNAVHRIDPRTGTVDLTIPLPGEPSGLTVGEGRVWASICDSGVVAVVNPVSESVQTLAAGPHPGDLALADGVLWVANGTDGTIARIETSTQAMELVTVGGPVRDVVADGNEVWVSVVADPLAPAC